MRTLHKKSRSELIVNELGDVPIGELYGRIVQLREDLKEINARRYEVRRRVAELASKKSYFDRERKKAFEKEHAMLEEVVSVHRGVVDTFQKEIDRRKNNG